MRRLALLALVVLLSPAAEGRTSGVRVLHLRYPVATLSAEGTRVAVGPAPHSPQLADLHTPPFVLWNVSTGATRRVAAGRCAQPWGTTLAGGRVAYVCENACCESIEQRVLVVERDGTRRSVFHVTSSYASNPRPTVTAIAGGKSLIAFSTSRLARDGTEIERRLWRIDRTRAKVILGGGDAVAPQDVWNARIAAVGKDQRVVVVRGDGTVVRRVSPPLAPDEARHAQPPGRGRILLWDPPYVLWIQNGYVTSGNPRGHAVALAGGATPGGCARDLVAYTTADAVHVVRLRDGHDVRFGVGDGYPVATDITGAGLFFASVASPPWTDPDQANGRYKRPSRVVFVPMRAVLARLAR